MPGTKPPRIIAGTAKNKKLQSLPGFATRPLLGRIKKSLFDILAPRIEGSSFLDLYAGIGNVGIEALSRGSDRALFIDNSRDSIDVIKQNIAHCGFTEKAKLIKADIIANFPKLSEKFDIIFIGPPYKLNLTQKTIDIISERDILSPDGIIVAQHHIRELVPEEIGKYRLFRKKEYSDTRLSFFERGEQ
ncbi:MAG: 16S rRNA (guanine(966)-N(2))-methyltransferase RsmD [bacterium]